MADDEKEARRRKHQKKMTKIVSKAWALPHSAPFQESHHRSSVKVAYDLTTIGQHLDDGVYSFDRPGWEHFSRDLGGVYNRHIAKNGRHAKIAKEHMDQVSQWLGKVNPGLVKIASEYTPPAPHHHHSKKRKASESADGGTPKKKHASDKRNGEQPLTLGEREERAMQSLMTCVEEHGGDRSQVSSYRCKATKRLDGRYETTYYNPEGRRLRHMVDVCRFLGLVEDNKKKKHKQKQKSSKKHMTYRECENQKKRLRREIEKLHRAHVKATKALDDFQTEQKESRYPVDDEVLVEEEAAKGAPLVVTRANCPAARVPDIDGFPGVPAHCIPDLLMTWDFLCTFSRALGLNPISLDDFAAAITYAPQGGTKDLEIAAPVYLAEAHLGLLKLLLNDASSDDWWWCTLETDEAAIAEGAFVDAAVSNDNAENNLPVIKVDMAALLCEEEDPLITASWLQALEDVRNHRTNAGGQIRLAVKSALSVVSNKWVKAYLKKSIRIGTGNSAGFTKRAVLWLVDRVRDARPDLWGRNVSKESVFEHRAKVAEEAAIAMEKMDDAAEAVTLEDVEGDSDEEMDSDDSDDDDETNGDKNAGAKINGDLSAQDESSTPVRSSIPPRPPPSLVDLLLPPAKPAASSDIVSPFTWPFIAGAAASRILHRYKRQRNEVDDSIRDDQELPPMSIADRRSRESVAAMRVLSECAANGADTNPSEQAISHLCTGGAYLSLSLVERLCIFRLLIEAAYDTGRVYEVVSDNFNSRINALKALEGEKRRAKREAKEEAATAEAAARSQLALDAKFKFLQEKRKQIYESNKETNEYTSEFLDDLIDEDIAEFDDETKAEYDALPGPERFNKTEVNKMVAKMQEEAAFGTHSLSVLTMDEIRSREKSDLTTMETELASFGDLSENNYMDRETSKNIERLRKDIDNAKHLEASLPEVRETAVETLKDAIEDGTIKVLRAAIRVAKQAKLSGPDDETDGLWALDLLRDAALELKTAESRKRVTDAQKDLVAKRNKCFIRTEPLGRDRFRNRFWSFDPDLVGRVWVEVDFILKKGSNDENMQQNDSGHVNLLLDEKSLIIGEPDKEEDLPRGANPIFRRQEYDTTGTIAGLTKRFWGAHITEKSFRSLIKHLDKRGVRENELRTNLQATLEDSGLSATSEGHKEEDKGNDDTADEYLTSGDEHVLSSAKGAPVTSSVVDPSLIASFSSAIGERVRFREVLDPAKVPVLASYNMGTVLGWRMYTEEDNGDDAATENQEKPVPDPVTMPVWRVVFDHGGEALLEGHEVIESLCRAIKWKNGATGYFEDDSAMLAYRNSLGRYCGRAADAAQASTPMALARLMVKREQELYTRMKNRTFDNNWGGKSGTRNVWISTMREYCFDLNTVRNGLTTLENAFFELTGGFPDNDQENQIVNRSAKDLLDDESSRLEIELESLEKQVRGLWNSPQSRSIFHEIVGSSTTTGFLALAFDLLCRNCWAYLNAQKFPEVRGVATQPKTTRRMNAWQQANQTFYY